MDGLYEQITTILTNPPGSLAFYLIMMVCVLSLLQVTLMTSNGNHTDQKKRLLLGTGIVLISQVILFLVTAFSWQTPVLAHYILPALDRTLTLFSFILIGWLWAYPTPHRLADIAVVLLSSLIIVLGIFSYLFWINQPPTAFFNSSRLDLIWNIVSIAVLIITCGAILLQKSNSRLGGLYFSILNLGGYVLHFMAAAPDGDLTASVRLAQLLTFPLLPLLARSLLSKQAPPEDASWPLITRIETEDDFESTSASPLTFSPQPDTNAQEEIKRVSYQLAEATELLNEANRRIAGLETEKQKLIEENQNKTIALPIPVPAPAPIPAAAPSNDFSTVQILTQGLRQPLASIIASATLINTEGIGVLGSLQRNFLTEIISTSESIVSRLDNYQRYPDRINNTAPLFPGSDLNSGIDAAIATMNTPIRTKDITLRFDISEFAQPMVISPNGLEQILVNLLQNAVLVSPPEATINLTIQEKEDEEGHAGLLIQVTDAGGGVANRHIDKIFIKKPGAPEPRYRGIGSLSNIHLAKTIIEVYNGKIWLESANKETTFSAFIPF
jgi:signal transduction histidine kinase